MYTDKLIEQIKNGDPQAFKELINHFKDKVFNTCYGFVQNKADADDLAQEVFIEIYRSIHNYKGESTLSTWIYRISTNKAIDLLRKNKRQRKAGLHTAEDDELLNIQHEDDKNPQEVLEQKERIHVLNQAIAQLPKNQKIAFTLNKYEQLSYKEIAEIMQTSVSSVESLLFRAKGNLQKLLKKYYKNNYI